ncbi:xylose isomerase domain-containing protein TIM barrel [Rhodopirellula maiorica SM1]|uniref:Xylose isomerase domain-containing protein TIM barrel n=1 Tax=Rhodopirellula maiorica SM1 TaxID=1265738 RepID=M5RNI7_9BACT|nr:sugar phosphate isomerase/epimerase [Rhodopirellula maiorica]EMI20855.1 xylose isomerase domain-containing protein TIM barrel [Rhodopirellula maiorica SM1]
MTSSTLSRRGFLAAATATAAAAATLPSTAMAATADRAQLGIQLYSLRGYKVDEALRHAKDLGFDQVEFYSGMLSTGASADDIAKMKAKVAELGLSISAHGVNRFGGNEAANRKIFEFAKALAIPTITADPGPESFDNLDDLVKEFDIRIAIHNHGPGHRYNKVVDVLRAIEGHDKRIGACADLGHYIRSGENATDVIRSLKGRLYGIHLKDFAEMKQKTEGVILGQGHLDVEGVFFALSEVGFPSNGAISLEYEENPQNPLAEIRDCVAVARAAMAKVAR